MHKSIVERNVTTTLIVKAANDDLKQNNAKLMLWSIINVLIFTLLILLTRVIYQFPDDSFSGHL